MKFSTRATTPAAVRNVWRQPPAAPKRPGSETEKAGKEIVPALKYCILYTIYHDVVNAEVG